MIGGNDLNTGMRCIKYMLIIFNLLFVITGIMLVIVGSTINTIYSDYSHFLETRFFSPGTLVVSIGFIVFAVACLGFVGAVRESTCMIMMFAFFLQVIFILEMSAGISGYFLIKNVRDFLTNSLNKTMHEYSTNDEANNVMNSLQEELQCCGLHGLRDWKDIIPHGEKIMVPQSCCKSNGTNSCAGYYDKGCLPRLEFVIKESGMLLAGTAISLSCLQLVGVIFSFTLGRMLRIQKTKREYRRWMIREELLRNCDQYSSIAHKYPTKNKEMKILEQK